MHSFNSGGTMTNNTGFPFYLDMNLADGKKLGLLPTEVPYGPASLSSGNSPVETPRGGFLPKKVETPTW